MLPRKIFSSPYLLLCLTVLFWSGNFVLARGMHEDVPPVALSFWRWFTAWLILFPFLLRPTIKQLPVIFRRWKMLALFGVLGVAGFSTLIYTGLATTTATNGVLLNTTSPVLIVLISRFLLREPISRLQGLGVAVAFLGVIVIVTRGEAAVLSGLHPHSGDVIVLTGVLCWALYTVLLRLRPQELSPLPFLFATVSMGVMMILPFFLRERGGGAAVTLTPGILTGIAYLAVFPSILSYIFWNHAVAQVGPNRAGFFIYLMPAFGVVLSLVFLHESLRLYHLTGIVLIFAGVYLTTTKKKTS